MAFESYDPRDDIRAKIGTNKYDFELDKEYYCVVVSDAEGEDIDIQMWDREEIKSREQPSLPYVSMSLVHVMNHPHNIGASVRKFIAYIDLDVAYVATSNIDIKDFGKKIKNELHDKIRTYQATTNNVFFMNIENENYIDDETEARQMVFHYILTLKVENHDAC